MMAAWQQFLKLPKEQLSTDSGHRAPPSVPTPSSLKRHPCPLFSKRRSLRLGIPIGLVKNYLHAKQLPIAHCPSVFLSPEEEEEKEEENKKEDYKQWLDIKVSPQEEAETEGVIAKLAHFVAEGSPELEKAAMEDYKDNRAFTFLHDKNIREFCTTERR